MQCDDNLPNSTFQSQYDEIGRGDKSLILILSANSRAMKIQLDPHILCYFPVGFGRKPDGAGGDNQSIGCATTRK